ncbi:hypothetical protein BU24DRAFT_429055 [Aaosphaeria arxii CBS 175.79]|uniref:Uncharacterized protein n=1 Tax=Aaosphaeria arxii CBS 175.79 TaxID=1450172 RepID=A0A6A5X732_9PLEO|nr:uncharacterized protein BU24DRAFT_429055 [Aaosphaeria arxii CBS 175.79]KAF2008748.1 hypothetical protein BU24DRAFT_429055 [Aaosphaeria arxii CBS 175.79]
MNITLVADDRLEDQTGEYKLRIKPVRPCCVMLPRNPTKANYKLQYNVRKRFNSWILTAV